MNSRYRIYAAVALALLVLGGGFMVLKPGGSSMSAPAPAIKPLHPVKKAKKAAARRARPSKTARVSKKPAPKVKAGTPLAPPKVAKTNSATDGMPAALSRALKAHAVVVVSLVVPGATVDDLSYREARAGAAVAGVGFVKIDAGNNDDVQALSTLVDANADPSNRILDAPAVMVFRRPQDLYVRINGYIDAATVAQAAENAAPLAPVQSAKGPLASAWVTGANAACEKFKQDLASTALPSAQDQVLPWIEALLAKTHAVVATLHGLTPPKGRQARVTAMLADYDEMLKDIDAELAAVKKGDLETVRKLDPEARAAGARGDSIAASLGATSCSGRWS